MNSIVKSRTAGATILLAVLLGSAACGTETVSENGPGSQPGIEARIYPPVSVPTAPVGKSSHEVACLPTPPSARPPQEKARQDRASTERWARGTQIENKLQAGSPGRP